MSIGKHWDLEGMSRAAGEQGARSAVTETYQVDRRGNEHRATKQSGRAAGDSGFQIVWRTPEGGVVACVEKNKVLQENLVEIHQVCQDALADAVLMGCDEQQFRQVLASLVEQLKNPFSPRE